MTTVPKILVGKTREGLEVYYTGGAGERWVSTNRTEAWTYDNIDLANETATRFNRGLDLHGILFCVGPHVKTMPTTHGFTTQYQRAGLFPLEMVHDNLDHAIQFDGDYIYLGSQRYHLFARGVCCVKCGVEGKYYAKERSTKLNKKTGERTIIHEKWHLNLYGVRADGAEVLMTKDHIIPRSRGGADSLDNYQTMCTKCNGKKRNYLDGETAKEIQQFKLGSAAKIKDPIQIAKIVKSD